MCVHRVVEPFLRDGEEGFDGFVEDELELRDGGERGDIERHGRGRGGTLLDAMEASTNSFIRRVSRPYRSVRLGIRSSRSHTQSLRTIFIRKTKEKGKRETYTGVYHTTYSCYCPPTLPS